MGAAGRDSWHSQELRIRRVSGISRAGGTGEDTLCSGAGRDTVPFCDGQAEGDRIWTSPRATGGSSLAMVKV
jgi:hypothetical protein